MIFLETQRVVAILTIYNDNGLKVEKSETAEFMNDYFTYIGEALNRDNNTTWWPHSMFQDLSPNGFMLKDRQKWTQLELRYWTYFRNYQGYDKM